MEVVQGVRNGYSVLNLEMNKVQQCNSCILNTLHHGIIMMSDNNGIPDNNGKIQDNNEKIPWRQGCEVLTKESCSLHKPRKVSKLYKAVK